MIGGDDDDAVEGGRGGGRAAAVGSGLALGEARRRAPATIPRWVGASASEAGWTQTLSFKHRAGPSQEFDFAYYYNACARSFHCDVICEVNECLHIK